MRRVIPNKYSISNGFVVAADDEGNIVHSSQTDILIWDSCNYSPLFRDDDFVIIPPESCRIMIEVKGVLTRDDIKKTINNFDKLISLKEIPYLKQCDYNFSKYIFAYDTKIKKYPEGIFDVLSNTYNNHTDLSLENRLNLIERYFSSSYGGYCPLFTIDGIFVLTKGFIDCSKIKMEDKKLKLLFSSYSTEKDNESNIYSVFETELLSLLGPFSGGRRSWNEQIGLFSLRKQLRISPSSPKSILILPETNSQYYSNYIDENMVYSKKG